MIGDDVLTREISPADAEAAAEKVRALQSSYYAVDVTACNRNQPGLQSARFQDHIHCIYRPAQDHIHCN